MGKNEGESKIGWEGESGKEILKEREERGTLHKKRVREEGWARRDKNERG